MNLEKTKQALEKETSELHVEIRSLTQSKQDVENKRKKVEGQLVDLQSRFNDSEKQKAELGDRVSKVTVSYFVVSRIKSFRFKRKPSILIYHLFLIYRWNLKASPIF